MRRHALSRSSILALFALLAACGGRTFNPAGDPPDTGVTPLDAGSDADFDTGVTTGPTCVEVTVSAGDVACNQDSDCTEATTGSICADTCDCGGTAVNNRGAERIAIEVQGLENGACACPAFGSSTCVNHVCTLCGFGPSPAPGCPTECDDGIFECDGGAPDADIVDGGDPDDDASAPVDAGFDADPRAGLGTMDCGPNVCNASTEYCYSSCGGDPLNSLSCLPIPSSCLNAADPCACYIDLVNPGKDTPDAACLCTILAILPDAGSCNEFLRYSSQ
jgi:hypothetical protein